MWVMLNDAWLSIVADNTDEEFLLVRSRRRGDIERIFGTEEEVNVSADYHFRQFIHRDHVAGVMAREVQRISYPNFKNSVKDPQLKEAFTSVWTIGYKMQWENYDKGVQRRRVVPTMMASDEVDLCSWCQEEIDHSFHAPEMGQPVDVCEDCWRQHGKDALNNWYDEQEVAAEEDAAQISLVK